MNNTKILVVDDEPDIRFLLKDILEDEGYQVEVAENAGQAEDYKSRFLPNLILLDIWMPEVDGVTLLKQWHEHKRLDCPVVMMSGHGTVETAVEATRYGAFDFVEKPLSTAKLIRTVKSALVSAQNDDTAEFSAEQPVGNSLVMQNLKQTMKNLAQDRRPVFLHSEQALDARIWAGYLFRQQNGAMAVKTSLGSEQDYVGGLQHNLYIEEVTELNQSQQQLLLSLVHKQESLTQGGRLLVCSALNFTQLSARSEVLTALAEYWKQSITIPTLNDRIEDIPELVEYYVTWFSEHEDLPYRHFGVAAQNLLRNNHWQDGLQSLKSVIQLILQSGNSDNVELDEIRSALQPAINVPMPTSTMTDDANTLHLSINLDYDMREAREHFEREYLKKQLELCRYNVSELARKVGQERTNLYRKLKSLGLQNKK